MQRVNPGAIRTCYIIHVTFKKPCMILPLSPRDATQEHLGSFYDRKRSPDDMAYQSGLCACFADVTVCLYGTFMSPCLAADTWARMRNERFTLCHCLCPHHPFWIRQFVKNRYGIETSYASDCAVFCFCCPCGVCQDAREVRLREAMATA